MANTVGVRYFCRTSGAEVIVTKGGDGELSCCGWPMQRKQRE